MTADGAIFWKSGREITTDGVNRPTPGFYLIAGICGSPDVDREVGLACRRQLIPADAGKHRAIDDLCVAGNTVAGEPWRGS